MFPKNKNTFSTFVVYAYQDEWKKTSGLFKIIRILRGTLKVTESGALHIARLENSAPVQNTVGITMLEKWFFMVVSMLSQWCFSKKTIGRNIRVFYFFLIS